jgi:2OG-Fe(II) oxygenase superfamily
LQQEDIQKTVDALFEALAQDERVLSVRERALLASIIQYARATSTSPEVDTIVMERIINAVESAIAQHIQRLVGNAVVQRLLSPQLGPNFDPIFQPPAFPPLPPAFPPLPPAFPPPPPAFPPPPPAFPPPPPAFPPPPPDFPPEPPAFPPLPPAFPPEPPVFPPEPPVFPPEPPGSEIGFGGIPAIIGDGAVDIIAEEVLAQEEIAALAEYTLAREADFVVSSVIGPGATTEITDFEQGQTRILRSLGELQVMIAKRIQVLLPHVFEQLKFSSFPSSLGETYLMASGEGDSFRSHKEELDAASPPEEITFVYFYHREPKAFTGGELRIYEESIENGRRVASKTFRTIIPQQNRMVFFPSRFVYEILPVHSPSGAFADSHFTLHGRIRK